MNLAPDARHLRPGLVDSALDSQRIFRAVLDAFAQPGRVIAMPVALDTPAPLHAASAAIALALLDCDTPLWLQSRDAGTVDYLRFHCACRVVDEPAQAKFAILQSGKAMPPLTSFNVGTPEYPDRSATLIIEVPRLYVGHGRRLRGPGIDASVRLDVPALRTSFWSEWDRNYRSFPCGVDVVFACRDELVALPRTTAAEG